MLIDLHTHTYPRSDDSFMSLDQLITQAKGVGLDAICLTDHDWFWDPETIAALSSEYGFPIFPGCEVTTEEGHLLVFGLDRYVFGMHRASLVRELVDKAGGAIVVAHPYRRTYHAEEASDEDKYSSMVRRACENSVFSVADGVEVLNGRGSAAENAFALELSKWRGLKGIGTSDAHMPNDLGTFATEFRQRIGSLAELIQELKAGNFQPVAMKKPQLAA